MEFFKELKKLWTLKFSIIITLNIIIIIIIIIINFFTVELKNRQEHKCGLVAIIINFAIKTEMILP